MTVSLEAWQLALTWVVSMGLGYGSCYYGVLHIGRALMFRNRSHRETGDMTHRRTPWAAILILIASAMVISIGIMSYIGHREDEKDDAQDRAVDAAYDQCITDWGDDLVAAVKDNREARKELDTAEERRADATAAVLRTVLLARADPPRATEKEFSQMLREAVSADGAVADSRARLAATQIESDYVAPTLACASERAAE